MPSTVQSPLTPPLDTPSGWRPSDELTPISPDTTLRDAYDWLVIGAGITGLGAATRLGEIASNDSVLLVDARSVGWGASGRNSGFLLDLPHKYDLESRDRDRLTKITRLNRLAIEMLRDRSEAFDIACDWSEVGKLQGAVRERGTGMLRDFTEALDWLGQSYEVWERDACDAMIGTRHYAAAVFTPGAVLVDPLQLVRGLAGALADNVTLADDTPVVRFEKTPAGYRVLMRRPDGQQFDVLAKRVILATDPYTGQFGYMKTKIVPTITFASITRPLSACELKRYRGRLNWGLTPADPAGTTLRMTSEGRLLIRNHYGRIRR
ncbi:MAG: FAD-dependent oxidoreductase [Pseudomonadota bacterium]